MVRNRSSKRTRCCLYVVVVTIGLCILLWYETAELGHYIYLEVPELYGCSLKSGNQFLQRLCSEYSRGEVTGSLCEPLCSGNEIHLQKCFGAHKQKGLVVQVQWNGETTILKTFINLSPSDLVSRPLWRQYIGEMEGGGDKSWKMQLSRAQFIERANATLFYGMFGRRDSHAQTLQLLNNILEECDVHKDGVLTDSEAHTCWRALTTEEYVLYTLFKGQDNMLRTRGVCGDVFAVEFVSSIASHDVLGYKSYLAGQQPWSYRAKLGIALLDMIAFFEKTPYGTLHTCDVKETNYGVSKVDGRVVAKANDLDHSWFGKNVSTMAFDQLVFNNSCKSDSDCFFINACYTKCIAGRCSNRLISNNIQALCRRIFVKKLWMPNIFQNPPKFIKRKLQRLLAKCVRPGEMDDQTSQYLITQLREVLASSIYMT